MIFTFSKYLKEKMKNITPCFFRTREDSGVAASFELTYKCNLNCKHCMNHLYINSDNGMKYDKIKKLISELESLNVKSIYFTGGEPLLREDISEILKTTYDYGLEVRIATNGIEVDKYIKVIKNYVCEVSISLDAVGIKYDMVRDKPGLFNKVVSAIELLQSENIRCVISTVISDANYDHMEQILHFVKAKGIPQISFAFLVPVSGIIDELHITAKKYSEVVKKINALKKEYESDVFHILFRRSCLLNSESIDCKGGTKIIHINPYGKIFPCSWCGKIEQNESLSAQWEPGNLGECLRKVSQLENIVETRKNKWGYSGCPAIASIYKNNLLDEDPLNEFINVK